MCSGCQKWLREFVNGQLVIRRVACPCKCQSTELSDPPRCLECGCKIPITLTDEADSWEECPPWTNEEGNMLNRNLEKAE